MLRVIPKAGLEIRREAKEFASERSHSAKYQRSTGAICARATKAHRRLTPGSCNGLFSPGISLQRAWGLLPHPTQTNQFHYFASHFPIGQALKTTGRLNCLLLQCNFQRVAQATLHCKHCVKIYPAKPRSPRCNFSRIATTERERKGRVCGKLVFLWET